VYILYRFIFAVLAVTVFWIVFYMYSLYIQTGADLITCASFCLLFAPHSHSISFKLLVFD